MQQQAGQWQPPIQQYAMPPQGWVPWQSQASAWPQQQPQWQPPPIVQPQPVAPTPAVPEPEPQVAFIELLRLCAYLHAVGESESLARLLLHLDDSPARFQQPHIADLHRAELDNALGKWPKELPASLLEAMSMAVATLFDLLPQGLGTDARPLIQQPSAYACIQVDEREGRPYAHLQIEAAAELHSTLLNGSNRLHPQLAEIMQIHDEHLRHTRRMQKRMSALQTYFQPQ